MRLLSKRSEGVKDELICLLAEVKKGNLEAKEVLIEKYTPFILKIVSKQCGRYIYLGQDDEASIGLLAFDEAINAFNPKTNGSFLAFAELVIKRRLIDYFRKEKRETRLILVSNLKEDDDTENNMMQESIIGRSAIENYSKEEESRSRKEEILQYSKVLESFGLSFRELVEVSPKHQDARENAIKVAKLIAGDKILREKVLTKKSLPLKDIVDLVNISRKTIERNRKYIIAVFLVLVFEFTYLKEYLKDI